MANVLRIKRGLESNRTNVTPAEGEFLYTTDEKKLYIGDGTTDGGNLVSGGAASVSDNVYAVKGTVDLTSATVQDIGTLPADADVIRTYLIIGTASDAVTTVIVGDATNGASSYMTSTENDPEVLGTYIADTIVFNGGTDRTMQATVTTAGTVGSATCVVEYRLS